MTSEVKMLLRLQPHVLVEVRIQSTSSCDNFSLVGYFANWAKLRLMAVNLCWTNFNVHLDIVYFFCMLICKGDFRMLATSHSAAGKMPGHNFHIRRNGQTVLPSEVKYPKHTVGYIDSIVVRWSKGAPPIPEVEGLKRILGHEAWIMKYEKNEFRFSA